MPKIETGDVKILITAGGRGTRLWPLSTATKPKPFRSLLSDATMLQLTFDRVESIVSRDAIYVITSSEHIDLAKKQLPQCPEANLLEEPENRDTAPAIGYTAALIGARYPDAIMVVLASDQWVAPVEEFQEAVAISAAIARQGNYLVSIGVAPTFPNDGLWVYEMRRSLAILRWCLLWRRIC